jgi:hypothetical protein
MLIKSDDDVLRLVACNGSRHPLNPDDMIIDYFGGPFSLDRFLVDRGCKTQRDNIQALSRRGEISQYRNTDTPLPILLHSLPALPEKLSQGHSVRWRYPA